MMKSASSASISTAHAWAEQPSVHSGARPAGSLLRFVLPAAILAPSLVKIIAVHRIWLWDQCMYGIWCLRLWNALVHNTPAWPGIAYNAVSNFAPPMIAWAGQFFVPVGQALGSIDLGLSLLIIFCQGISLWLTFKIGMELSKGNPWIASCAALLLGTAPLFVSIGTEFLMEPFQILSVTYVYWIAVVCRRLKPHKLISHLLFAASLVVLAKASTPLYCVLPGLISVHCLLFQLRNPRKEPTTASPSDLLFLLLSVLSFVISIIWYSHNFSAVSGHVRDASFGEIALQYGNRAPFSVKLLSWLKRSDLAFFAPWCDLALVGSTLLSLLTVLIGRRQEIALRAVAEKYLITAAAVLQLVLIFATLASNIGDDLRFVAAALPSIVVLLSVFLSVVDLKSATAACVAVFVAQLILVEESEFSARKFIASEFDYAWQQPVPSQTIDKEITSLVRFLDQQEKDRPVFVGVNYSWINVNTLNFYALKQGLGHEQLCSFVSLPADTKTEMDEALTLIQQYHARYFVTLDPAKQPDGTEFANRLSRPLFDVADKYFKRIPFSSEAGIAIFEISRLNEVVAACMAKHSLNLCEGAREITFGSRLVLRDISFARQNKCILYRLRWKALYDQSLRYNVAVHLLNSKKEIVAQSDFKQSEVGERVSGGQEWTDAGTISDGNAESADEWLGLAIYDPEQSQPPLLIENGATDWDGRRLLVSLSSATNVSRNLAK